MTIETKDWYAQNDKMPGPPGSAKFRVRGKVTVNHPGIEAHLVPYDGMPMPGPAMRLSLKLQDQGGIHTAVLTEKEVSYQCEALQQTPVQVAIHHENEVVAEISVIETH